MTECIFNALAFLFLIVKVSNFEQTNNKTCNLCDPIHLHVQKPQEKINK